MADGPDDTGDSRRAARDLETFLGVAGPGVSGDRDRGGISRRIRPPGRGRRREPLDQAARMLRSLRQQGRDEDTLRQFVCIYSGNHWEEFYEALFGYEDKRKARVRWGRNERGRTRPKFAAWRDLIADWLDARIAARCEARETAVLWKIEERNLQSLGENLVTAHRKAKRSALAMVATAAEIKGSIRPQDGAIVVNRSITWAMREAAVKPETVLLDHERPASRA